MSPFKTAFAAARKAGKKEFTFNGKSYNTELAETVRPKARGSSTASTMGPKARPASTSTGPKPRPSAPVMSPRPRPTATPTVNSDKTKTGEGLSSKSVTSSAPPRARPKTNSADSPDYLNSARDTTRSNKSFVFDLKFQREAIAKKKREKKK